MYIFLIQANRYLNSLNLNRKGKMSLIILFMLICSLSSSSHAVDISSLISSMKEELVQLKNPRFGLSSSSIRAINKAIQELSPTDVIESLQVVITLAETLERDSSIPHRITQLIDQRKESFITASFAYLKSLSSLSRYTQYAIESAERELMRNDFSESNGILANLAVMIQQDKSMPAYVTSIIIQQIPEYTTAMKTPRQNNGTNSLSSGNAPKQNDPLKVVESNLNELASLPGISNQSKEAIESVSNTIQKLIFETERIKNDPAIPVEIKQRIFQAVNRCSNHGNRTKTNATITILLSFVSLISVYLA